MNSDAKRILRSGWLQHLLKASGLVDEGRDLDLLLKIMLAEDGFDVSRICT